MAGQEDFDQAGLAQAREALRAGDSERARALLEARIEAAPDPEALRLLGELLHGQGDLAGAGAVWFGAAVKGPEVNEAIEAWRSSLDGDFGRMWRSLPKSVRRRPGSARVEALRTRALGQASARTAPGEAPSAPVAASSEEAERALDRTASAPTPATPDAATPEIAATVDVEERRSIGGTVTKVDEDEDGDSGRGFDAAQVIAWVLAAFFVVCAVVGLITILQWLVPGS